MDFHNNPDFDEDGEPLMDPDAAGYSDTDDWANRQRSPTPPYHSPAVDATARRRRLVKSGSHTTDAMDGDELADGGGGLDDWDEMERQNRADDDEEYEVERKKEKKRKERERDGKGGKGSGKLARRAHEVDEGEREIQEMWDTIAGDGEDDQEGVRTLDDDAFIDDSGVDPADRYLASDNERSPRHAPEAEEGEEDDEVARLFKSGKRKKKNERPAADLGMLVERFIAEFEVAVEEDAKLNRLQKPAVNKLIKLPLLVEVLSKKNLQQEFLDHGVLTLLKSWLEPLPDGSLPNMTIRSAILKLLTDFPLDLEQHDRREQLKKSGLGKVIMFLSKSEEEDTANRMLAKELVDKWSRPIFNKSTRFEDMRVYDNERLPYRQPSVKKPSSSRAMQAREDDLEGISLDRKGVLNAERRHASRPEASPLNFLVRPQSKVDPDEVRARAKQVVQDQRRLKMNKKLQQLKAPKKRNLQASKVSIEGRGMVKYL